MDFLSGISENPEGTRTGMGHGAMPPLCRLRGAGRALKGAEPVCAWRRQASPGHAQER